MKLEVGQQITVAVIEELFRPITKRLNRISDLNVSALTTGQLRFKDNKISTVIQDKPESYDIIPNTSSIQMIPFSDDGADTAGIDLFKQMREDLAIIERMEA